MSGCNRGSPSPVPPTPSIPYSQSRRPQEGGGGGGGDRHRPERARDGESCARHSGQIPPLPEAEEGVGALSCCGVPGPPARGGRPALARGHGPILTSVVPGLPHPQRAGLGGGRSALPYPSPTPEPGPRVKLGGRCGGDTAKSCVPRRGGGPCARGWCGNALFPGAAPAFQSVAVLAAGDMQGRGTPVSPERGKSLSCPGGGTLRGRERSRCSPPPPQALGCSLSLHYPLPTLLSLSPSPPLRGLLACVKNKPSGKRSWAGVWSVGGGVGMVTHPAGPPGPPSPGERGGAPPGSPGPGCPCPGGVRAGVALGCGWRVSSPPPLDGAPWLVLWEWLQPPWDLLSPSNLGFFPMKFRLIYQPMGLGAAPGAVASFPIALLFAAAMKDAATRSSSSGDEGLAVLRPSRHQSFARGWFRQRFPAPTPTAAPPRAAAGRTGAAAGGGGLGGKVLWGG